MRQTKQDIGFLGIFLTEAGLTVLQAKADAECLILKTVVERVSTENVVLIGEDTDLLVLLLFHYKSDLYCVFFTPGKKQTAKSLPKVWNIRHVREKLQLNVCKNILFAHTFSGCDTTSSPFGIGKITPLKMIQTSSTFQNIADVFISDSEKDHIIAAGEKAFVIL